MARMSGNGHCRSFNGDGRMDIMARDDATGHLLVFPHTGSFRGSETFDKPELISTSFHPQRNHVVVRPIDVTGNGYADVIGVSMTYANATHGIFLYPNKGGLNGLDMAASLLTRCAGTRCISPMRHDGPQDGLKSVRQRVRCAPLPDASPTRGG